MELRFLATQELDTILTVFCLLLTFGWFIFFGSTIVEKAQKLFLPSLVWITLTSMVLILVATVNPYSDSFTQRYWWQMKFIIITIGVVLGVLAILSMIILLNKRNSSG